MAKRKKTKLNDAYRVERMQAGGLKGLASKTADKALPLILPRVNLPDSYIEDSAVRFARQLLGEHVRGKSGTTNLAGRSAKEVERLKNLDYKLEPWGTVAPEATYTPKAGEVRVGIPGDQTVANQTLVSLEDAPINSRQEGGSRYGLGQMHQKNPDEWEAWKSGKTQAEALQAKIDRLANLYGTDQVVGSHFAMGPVANNYAMHFADANLKAIDWSKVDFKKLKDFDKLIAYGDPVKGMYPDWPGLTNHELAMEVMRGNPNARKWFNSRMKVPEITKDVGLPNALDVQWAITEPRLRNMEVNTTGLMNYDMRPFRAVDQKGFKHGTYDSTIYGAAKGAQEVLAPFDIMFPDAAQHIASTQRPADFTGTIQKIYPHQVVDDQYINQYMKFIDRVKGLTKKEGGAVELKDGGQPDVEHMQAGGLKSLASGLAHAIPQVDRAANLAKYMEGAAIPDRLYHATTATQGGKGNEALRNLKPSKEGALGSGIYMTPSTDYANMYAQGEGGNVMPLFTNMRNPLKITGEHRDPMKEALIKLGVDPDKADAMVERAYESKGYIGKQVQSRAQAQGFDGIAQYKDGDLSEVVAFNPNSVKSAIGNTGEYMPYSGLLGKAEGGSVEHMQMGGLKGMVGAGAKLLPKVERDLNLAKFLEDSALKQRLYHGSNQMRLSDEGQRIYAPNEGFSELLPSGTGVLKSEFDKHPPAVFLSPSPEFAGRFAGLQVNEATPAVYPVHAKIKNPFDYANQAHMDALEREYIKTHIDSRQPAEGESLFDFKKANAALANDLRRSLESAKSHDANWNTLEDMKIQEIIRKLGHDAFYVTENGVKNIGVYDPKMIKSATGNQGTYDITTTELNKASGGVAHMQGGGLKNLVSGATKVLTKAERDANLTKFLEQSADPRKFYHTTNQDFSTFAQNSRGVHFVTPDVEFANKFAGSENFSDPGYSPSVMPLYVNVKNPFDFQNKKHVNTLATEASLGKLAIDQIKQGDWRRLEDRSTMEAIKKLGFDGLYVNEYGVKNLGVFDPTQIKSATGNRGTYDPSVPDITKAQGGQVEHMQSGGMKGMVGAGMRVLPEVENAIANIKEANRISIVPMPNRWFMQPDKFPQMQGLVEKVLERSGLPRESFTSGAYANPVTGEILDRRIFEDVGVAINPATNRPMMSAGKETGIDALEKELGALTRSNLVRKGLFKREGGDSLLDDLAFLATIERSGMGHKYGLSTEYGSPTLMFNTGRGENPTLRPTSRGDVFGMGDVVGRIKLGSGQHHDVYEKLFVAPKGMDVPGVKLHEDSGGAVHMADGGNPSLFSDKERELIFGEGVNNPLFSIYGNTPMPPANSPVIEATPQSPTQKAIGTLGGYLDKAGRFVTEAIEPIAQSNPIKAAIADMFIAEQLKNAGTALQDWTKTGRDYDERPYTSGPFYGGNTLQTFKFDPRTIDLLGVGQAGAYGATRLASAGAKAAAPYATKIDDVVREIYESNKIPQIGLSIKDVTPKALAPANEMGFYSPAEAAALNLQRKSGSGQAFLNDLLKQENVRPDEINSMGLDAFLKDKKNITATEVQDFIAKNKIQLGEARYGKLSPQEESAEWNRLAEREYGKSYGELYHDEAKSIERMIVSDTSKFSDYALPGGENYREVVITMPQNKTAVFPKQAELDAVEKQLAQLKAEGNREEFGKLIGTQTELRNERTKFLQTEQYRLDQEANKNQYRSSHWDEPNALAHLRMSDRVTDGKKTLLVDEVQSDWHQAGREQGYTEKYTPEELARISELRQKTDDQSISYAEMTEFTDLMNKNWQKVPDAPYKDDWYQLALRRAVKEAIDGGYDRVALPTGARVNERFDLSKHIESISHQKNPDGTYKIVAVDKNNRHAMNEMSVPEEKLSSIVGKDVAQKIINAEGTPFPEGTVGAGMTKLSGLDLKVGGEGNIKYYDEVYPNYLKKFGKKYGANVGSTQVEIPPKSSGDVLKYDGGQEYANGQITWKEFLQRSPQAAKDFSEPLHYMEITPAMREAFKTGIHMKDGGAVHMQSGGMPRTPVGGEMKHTSFQELREEMGMADGGDIMHKLVKHAAAGGEIDDLQHALAQKYLETLNA